MWGPPGGLNEFNQPCRLVFYDQVFTETGWNGLEIAWFTSDSDVTNPPDVFIPSPGVGAFDVYGADQVAIPSGGPVLYYVLWKEIVAKPLPAIPYFRYRVGALPIPF